MRIATRAFLAVLVGVGGGGAFAPAALGEMTSTPINSKLCETTGGGRFVKIPGFPGEKIDRRLLTDIEWLLERDHLHLSWSHSDTKPEKPARTVYTIKCPGTDIGGDETDPPAEDPAPSGGVASTIRKIQRQAVRETGGAER